MFRIVLHKTVSKKFDKLSRTDKKRISKAIESIAIDPYIGKPLHGELKGSRRVRIGDFRIIYDIDEPASVVIIHAIGSRGDVYK